MSDHISDWARQKEAKYRSLSHEALLKKDVQKQLKTSRHGTATTIAGGATILSHGLSVPLHGALTARHGALVLKSKAKETITESVIEDRGLQRRSPTFFQKLCNAVKGTADGGVGWDTVDKFLSKQ